MSEPISDASKLQSHLGQVVDLRGRYDIWDLGPHKVIMDLPDGRTQALRQVVNLVLGDGSVVRLWVRPAAEMKALNGATVIARGRLLAADAPSAKASTPSEAPSLIDIESIDPA